MGPHWRDFGLAYGPAGEVVDPRGVSAWTEQRITYHLSLIWFRVRFPPVELTNAAAIRSQGCPLPVSGYGIIASNNSRSSASVHGPVSQFLIIKKFV